MRRARYEEVKKKEKKQSIEDSYVACMEWGGIEGEYEGLLPLSKVFNLKWLDVMYKLSDISAEISGNDRKV